MENHTLIHYLTNECGYDYIDDDNIFYKDGKFWGYSMPIRLRNKPTFMDNVILDFLYERNNTRYLIKANHDISLLPQKTIIIFPKFVKGEEFTTQIIGRELFQKLM